MSVYKRIRTYKDKKTGKTKIVESENWHISYYFEGKQIREAVSPNKRVAEEAYKAVMGEIAQGRYSLRSDTKSPKFEEYAKVYLEYSKANKRSYESDKNTFKSLSAFLNGYKLSKITPFLIEKYRIERGKKEARMSKKPIAKATIDRELATLKAFFNMAIRDGKVDTNPVKEVKFFKEDNKKERILTVEEIQGLLVECHGHLKPIVTMALNTGMRLREILYLKWSYVDFNRNIIVVPKTNTKNKKTKKIPMNGLVVETLQGVERKSEYVFCNPQTGKPYYSIKTNFSKALKRAKLEGVRFHDLGHTAATMMVESGTDLATVKEILGVSSLEMVMRYTHPTTEGKMNAVKALERKMEDLGKHHSSTEAKMLSMPKVISNSNNKC
jgi:integrase